MARRRDSHDGKPSSSDCWEDQVVEVVFPTLLQACWRGGSKRRCADQAALEQTRQDALALLFRLLFLFYGEVRGKLPDDCRERMRQLRSDLASHGKNLRGGRTSSLAAAPPGGPSLGERLADLTAPFDGLFPLASKRPHAWPLDPQSAAGDCLAIAVDGLSRIKTADSSELEFIDYGPLAVRRLGSIYERLLNFRIEARAASTEQGLWHLRKDRTRRKTGGCFYTPEPIIDHILETAVGPVLERRLAQLQAELARATFVSTSENANGRRSNRASPAAHAVDRLFDFRVLDPAMGTGHFLLAAADFIARRTAEFLRRFPGSLVAQRLHEALGDRAGASGGSGGAAPAEAVDVRMLKQFAVEHCLFGIDLDPRAVQLARGSLWLEAPLRCGSLARFERPLRCGDALRQVEWENFPQPGEFDVVVGNPPYGAKLDATARRELARTLPLMKSTADTAAGFIERASHWAGAQGRVGLIVPKPLTYSYAWRRVRSFLCGRLERLVDVSRAWPEVRLEQAIIVFRNAEPTAGYQSAWSEAERIVPGAWMTWELADRFETLPCALSAGELRRLAALKFSGTTIGDVCRTFRGLPAQQCLDDQSGPPVIGGRDLERWRIRSVSGRLCEGSRFSLDAFRCEKLVFQNIIAHVSRPQPRIVLTGAYDDRQQVTLDTVNNITATDRRVNLLGLLGLLHSRLINWLVYGAIYNKAVRTMHFDQYFLNKIPLPAEWPALLERLAPAVRSCTAATARFGELARRLADAQRAETACEISESAALEMLLRVETPARRTETVEPLMGEAAWRALRTEALQLAESRRQAQERIDRLVAIAYGDHDAQPCAAPVRAAKIELFAGSPSTGFHGQAPAKPGAVIG